MYVYIIIHLQCCTCIQELQHKTVEDCSRRTSSRFSLAYTDTASPRSTDNWLGSTATPWGVPISVHYWLDIWYAQRVLHFRRSSLNLGVHARGLQYLVCPSVGLSVYLYSQTRGNKVACERYTRLQCNKRSKKKCPILLKQTHWITRYGSSQRTMLMAQPSN